MSIFVGIVDLEVSTWHKGATAPCPPLALNGVHVKRLGPGTFTHSYAHIARKILFFHGLGGFEMIVGPLIAQFFMELMVLK